MDATASTVKLAGRDVLASWKVIVSLIFLPLEWTTYTLAFGALLLFYPDAPFLVTYTRAPLGQQRNDNLTRATACVFGCRLG